ncbi:MAG: response regulator [Polaromonas sp.]|nr:response regulator [Polaromonas sp.]
MSQEITKAAAHQATIATRLHGLTVLSGVLFNGLKTVADQIGEFRMDPKTVQFSVQFDRMRRLAMFCGAWGIGNHLAMLQELASIVEEADVGGTRTGSVSRDTQTDRVKALADGIQGIGNYLKAIANGNVASNSALNESYIKVLRKAHPSFLDLPTNEAVELLFMLTPPSLEVDADWFPSEAASRSDLLDAMNDVVVKHDLSRLNLDRMALSNPYRSLCALFNIAAAIHAVIDTKLLRDDFIKEVDRLRQILIVEDPITAPGPSPFVFSRLLHALACMERGDEDIQFFRDRYSLRKPGASTIFMQDVAKKFSDAMRKLEEHYKQAVLSNSAQPVRQTAATVARDAHKLESPAFSLVAKLFAQETEQWSAEEGASKESWIQGAGHILLLQECANTWGNRQVQEELLMVARNMELTGGLGQCLSMQRQAQSTAIRKVCHLIGVDFHEIHRNIEASLRSVGAADLSDREAERVAQAIGEGRLKNHLNVVIGALRCLNLPLAAAETYGILEAAVAPQSWQTNDSRMDLFTRLSKIHIHIAQIRPGSLIDIDPEMFPTVMVDEIVEAKVPALQGATAASQITAPAEALDVDPQPSPAAEITPPTFSPSVVLPDDHATFGVADEPQDFETGSILGGLDEQMRFAPSSVQPVDVDIATEPAPSAAAAPVLPVVLTDVVEADSTQASDASEVSGEALQSSAAADASAIQADDAVEPDVPSHAIEASEPELQPEQTLDVSVHSEPGIEPVAGEVAPQALGAVSPVDLVEPSVEPEVTQVSDLSMALDSSDSTLTHEGAHPTSVSSDSMEHDLPLAEPAEMLASESEAMAVALLASSEIPDAPAMIPTVGEADARDLEAVDEAAIVDFDTEPVESLVSAEASGADPALNLVHSEGSDVTEIESADGVDLVAGHPESMEVQPPPVTAQEVDAIEPVLSAPPTSAGAFDLDSDPDDWDDDAFNDMFEPKRPATYERAMSLDEMEATFLAAGEGVQNLIDTSDTELLKIMFEESYQNLDGVDKHLSDVTVTDRDVKGVVADVQRMVHTLKGVCRTCKLAGAGSILHLMEDEFEKMPDSTRVLGENAQPFIAAMRQVRAIIDAAKAIFDSSSNGGVHVVVPGAPVAKPAAMAPRSMLSGSTPASTGATVRIPVALASKVGMMSSRMMVEARRAEGELLRAMKFCKELDVNLSRIGPAMRDLVSMAETGAVNAISASGQATEDFDALELDRYTTVQEAARRVIEAYEDAVGSQASLQEVLRFALTSEDQRSDLSSDLQRGSSELMLLPLTQQRSRLNGTVEQACSDTGKKARLEIKGESRIPADAMDKLMGSIEHILRNALAHGIESPEKRLAIGKPEEGRIVIGAPADDITEGGMVRLSIRDDGAGIDLERVLNIAIQKRLVKPTDRLSEDAIRDLLFMEGFSTAESVNQMAGRGVGLDVVKNALSNLGGRVSVRSERGQGTEFILTIPTDAASMAVVQVGVGTFSCLIPVTLIQRIVPVSLTSEVVIDQENNRVSIGGVEHELIKLHDKVPLAASPVPAKGNIVLMRQSNVTKAVWVDTIGQQVRILVKQLGPFVRNVPGMIAGAVLGDGLPAIVLNPLQLADVIEKVQVHDEAPAVEVMVVDDSSTMRLATSRVLTKNGFTVETAGDGLATLQKLNKGAAPKIFLVDLEMPGMGGFELIAEIRRRPAHANTPIIVVSSRTAQKHRDKATAMGADVYITKPYDESELLSAIKAQLATPVE